jgi:hypothetical protein
MVMTWLPCQAVLYLFSSAVQQLTNCSEYKVYIQFLQVTHLTTEEQATMADLGTMTELVQLAFCHNS